MSPRPLLTIAIPTHKRADYLRSNLLRLNEESRMLDRELLEFIVSDNASPDHTEKVVQEAQSLGLPIAYHRKPENIGSDANIAETFNLARGRYVLLLGDDDLLVPGSLAWLMDRLQEADRGVICLRPFGYDNDPELEAPVLNLPDLDHLDAERFLIKAGALITFISSCVINKELLGEIDARQFMGTNLVQVDLVIRAALAARSNMVTQVYRIACKRNNSGGYNFFEVFVEKLGAIIDSYRGRGLTEQGIRRFENALLIGFYPQYLLKMRLQGDDLANAARRLQKRYGDGAAFKIFVAPILWLPKVPAVAWGGAATAIGRVLRGDFYRGLMFIRARVNRRFHLR